MLWISIFILVVLIFISKTCIIVPSRQVFLVEKLGKFDRKLEPGFHILIPFIETVSDRNKIDIREQVIDVPPQPCTTRDNIPIEVDGVLYLKVEDPELARYKIQDYQRACINLAQTTMRAEIGKLTLDRTFCERERINENIIAEIDPASDPWGVKVLRYEIKNITLPHRVVDTMEKQMEAERQKRANILLANAEKTMLVSRSEADKQEAMNLSEGAKIQKINEAKGRAQGIILVANATAKGIERVGQAISRPGGNAALKMRLVEQFIEQMNNILENSHISVVPTELAAMKGFFEGMGHVTNGVADADAHVVHNMPPARKTVPVKAVPSSK